VPECLLFIIVYEVATYSYHIRLFLIVQIPASVEIVCSYACRNNKNMLNELITVVCLMDITVSCHIQQCFNIDITNT